MARQLNRKRQTPANARANADVRDAERRARRKMSRLRARGIDTRSISPIRDIDKRDTWGLKSYARQLEKFISRDNRYVPGAAGTPLPYVEFRDYKRYERELNKRRQREWNAIKSAKVYGTDMTIEEREAVGTLKGRLSSRLLDVQPESFRSVSEIRKRVTNLKRMLSPTYEHNRYVTLKENLLEAANKMGNDDLVNVIDDMNETQLRVLYMQSDFVETVMMSYEWIGSSAKGRKSMTDEQRLQLDAMSNSVLDIARSVMRDVRG